MASTGQIPDRFGVPSGLGRSATKRILASLREAGLVPSSGKGGGKSAVHFEPCHYANLMFGFAGFANLMTGVESAPEPVDPAGAAKLFREFQFIRGTNDKPSTIPGSLGKVVESLIEGAGHLSADEYESLPITPNIILCLNPPTAQLIWPVEKNKPIMEDYVPPPGKPYTLGALGVVRRTEVSWKMLSLAGELWRETPSRTKRQPDQKRASNSWSHIPHHREENPNPGPQHGSVAPPTSGIDQDHPFECPLPALQPADPAEIQRQEHTSRRNRMRHG